MTQKWQGFNIFLYYLISGDVEKPKSSYNVMTITTNLKHINEIKLNLLWAL